jgi:hypothetical protein
MWPTCTKFAIFLCTVLSSPASVRNLAYPICFKISGCKKFFILDVIGLRYLASLVSRHDLLFSSGFAALLIRDILVWIRMLFRILGSVPLTNGSGSGRPIHIRSRNTGTLVKSHKEVTETVEIKVRTIFASCDDGRIRTLSRILTCDLRMLMGMREAQKWIRRIRIPNTGFHKFLLRFILKMVW